MKKLITSSLLGITALFAVSCSKSNNPVTPAPAPGVEKRLVSSNYVFNGNIQTEDIKYDGEGRISVYKDEDDTYTFDYQSKTFLLVTRKDNTTGTVNRTFECALNTAGAITKMVFKTPAGVQDYQYDFTYNADGYMTKVKGSYSPTNYYENEFTLVNGNVVSAKAYDNGIQTRNEEYTYDLSKKEKGPYTHWYYWPSKTLFGKTRTNILTETKTFDMTGTLNWDVKQGYVLDADGYVIKRNYQNILLATSGVQDYIYQ